jgi:hypothetical protein
MRHERGDKYDPLQFVRTLNHGSWLNMAEIKLSFLTGQCLKKSKNIFYDRVPVLFSFWKCSYISEYVALSKASHALANSPIPVFQETVTE